MIYIPEVFLSLGFLIILIISVFVKRNQNIVLGYLSLLLIFLTQFFVLKDIFLFEEIFNNFFVIDSFGSFLKSVILICAGFVIYFYLIVKNDSSLNRPEFSMIILISIIGMMLMVSSNDLLSLFVSIELQSLAFYVLAASRKNSTFSVDSGLKYFILGAFSSSLFLFGSSLLYGLSGTVNLEDFKDLFFWIFPGVFASLINLEEYYMNQDKEILLC